MNLVSKFFFMPSQSKINKFTSYLICLLPLALISGPFLPDLIVSIVALIFLFFSLYNRETEYYKEKYVLIFILFYLVLLSSSVLSDHKIHSLESSLFYFRFGLFSLATYYFLNKNKSLFFNFYLACVSSIVICVVHGYIYYFFEISLFNIISSDNLRMTLPFNDKMYLGGFLAKTIPLTLALHYYLNLKNRNFNFFVIVVLFLSSSLIYLSGERTAIAQFLIFLLFIFIFLKNIRISLIFFSVFLFVSLAIFSITNKEILDRNIYTSYSQLFNSEKGNINLFSEIHESHIKGAYKMFIDKPVIGQGPNNFRKLCDLEKFNINKHTCTTHPHNSYIQILAETGIVGFIFFLILPLYLTFVLLRYLFRTSNRNEIILTRAEILLYGCILLTFIPFLPSLNFFNNYINILYYLPIGFLLYINSFKSTL